MTKCNNAYKALRVVAACYRYLINANVLEVNLTVPDLLLRHVHIQFFFKCLKSEFGSKVPNFCLADCKSRVLLNQYNSIIFEKFIFFE